MSRRLAEGLVSLAAATLVVFLLIIAVPVFHASGGVGFTRVSDFVRGSSSKITVVHIPVGKDPGPVAYDPANGYLYVWNTGSHNITVINGSSNAVVTSISVKGTASSLIYCPSNEEVYAASEYDLSVINGTSDTVVKNVKGPPAGLGTVAYDPANGAVYYGPLGVTELASNLSKISSVSNKLTLIPVGYSAADVIYDPGSRSIVVSNFDTNSLSIVNSSSNIVTTVVLTAGQGPYFMTYDPANKAVYAPVFGSLTNSSGNLTVLGPKNTIVATLQIGACPWTATYDPANHDMYVSGRSGVGHCGLVSNITAVSSANKVVAMVKVGEDEYPTATYDPKNQEMVVPCSLSNTTYFIDGSNNTLLKTTVTSPRPLVALYDATNHDMLVVGFQSTTLRLAVIGPTNTRLTLITLGKGWGGGIAYDQADTDFYFTLGTDSVAVVE